MKNVLRAISAVAAAATIAASAVPALAAAGKAHTTHTAAKAKAATTYACPMCHDKFTAAQAKKDKMTCPMCKVALVPSKMASTGHKAGTHKKM